MGAFENLILHIISLCGNAIRLLYKNCVPVVMYHSIADNSEEIFYHWLSCPVELFEKHLKYLKKHGFTSISMKELFEHLKYNKEIPEKSIVHTFDDGYLDTWVNAYPILKKYGMIGTVFISLDFIDRRGRIRPNLEKVWKGEISEEKLTVWGYLSFKEMREMEKNGVIDVQSHAKTHTWIFKTPKIIDFRHPGDPYYWMDWNKDPDYKIRWLTETSGENIELGAPVYEYGEALVTREYKENLALKNHLIKYVNERGGEDFFNGEWRRELLEEANSFADNDSGSYETKDEYLNRVGEELYTSKSELGRNLNKEVDFICFPGNIYNEDVVKTAFDLGYLAYVASINKNGYQKNVFGNDPKSISRISIVNFFSGDVDIKKSGIFSFAFIINFYPLIYSKPFVFFKKTISLLISRITGR